MTPGMVSEELSKLDFPPPAELKLNIPKSDSKPVSPTNDDPFSPSSVFSNGTGDLSGPEPEAIVAARRKTRSESMSAELADALSKMNLPQPEHIFGPNEGGSSVQSKGKQGVSAEDWDKVKLADDVPEAVKEPVRMSHSRNPSRV